MTLQTPKQLDPIFPRFTNRSPVLVFSTGLSGLLLQVLEHLYGAQPLDASILVYDLLDIAAGLAWTGWGGSQEVL